MWTPALRCEGEEKKWKKEFLASLISITSLYANETILSVFEKSYEEEDLKTCLKNGLEKLNIKIDSEISSERLSAINFILKNTFENNIHKMRGEEDNKDENKAKEGQSSEQS